MNLNARFGALLVGMCFAFPVMSNISELNEAGQLQTVGNHCLDVNGPDLYKSSGGKVQLWSCNTAPNQQWWLIRGRIVNAGGRCLAVNVNQPQTVDCSRDKTQQWRLVNDNFLVNSNGKCLTMAADEKRSAVRMTKCNGDQNQNWTFTKVSKTGRLMIGNQQCLDINGPDLFNSRGGKVQTWNCGDSPNQRWWLVDNRMLNAGGRCLVLEDDRVKTVDCRKAKAQNWALRESTMFSAAGGCLAVSPSDLDKRGVSVRTQDCQPVRSQQWAFEGDFLTDKQVARNNTRPPASIIRQPQPPQSTQQPQQPGTLAIPKPANVQENTPPPASATRPRQPAQTTRQPEPQPQPGVLTIPRPNSGSQPTSRPATPKSPAQPSTARIEVEEVPEPSGVFNGIVAAHNKLRAEVGVEALRWSDTVAAYAQEWAEHLKTSENCTLKHRGADRAYGENIAGGGSITPSVAVRLWGAEKANFDGEAQVCQPGRVCGHYTQIVWRRTTELGCGMASCGGAAILVCSYNPPGNYTGQKAY